MISGPRHFEALARRLCWDPEALDLAADTAAWSALAPARRTRLGTLLAGFCVAESRVAADLAPFAPAAPDPATAAVFVAQHADEHRHALVFDRIAWLVLGVPGADPSARLEPVRALAPPSVLDLFERRLPAIAAALLDGRAELADGVALYHLVLEGVVLSAGQRALLDDLADGALPTVQAAVQLVERDERWHVGFGLRCLLDLQPGAPLLAALLRAGEAAAHAWGPAVPEAVRSRVAAQHRRRLAATGLLAPADHATVGRSD